MVDCPGRRYPVSPAGDEHRDSQLGRPCDSWDQAATAGRIAALRFLPFADLNQQAAAGGQPQRSLRGHPAQDVQAVAAAVQRHPWLVQPGLGRQQPDLPGGHVRHVGDQDVHAAVQRGGQRLEEVAGVDVGADRGEVAAGAGHRGGVDVGGVQLGGVQGGGERGAHRAGTAAQVDDHRARRGEPNSLADQELGAAAGHEDAGIHGYPQAAEVRPADDLFQRQAGCPPVHHGGELRRRGGRGDEQLRLVLGEHAPGGPQPGDDGGPGNRGRGDRHTGAR